MGGCNGGGIGAGAGSARVINSFAVVSYLADPLAGFLDRLRNDLVQDCFARAHVTVLPPRQLAGPADEAWRQAETSLQDVPPFRVELGEIEVFPVTQVIYLSVNTGNTELRRLHRALNTGRLAFEEPYVYHPHITLAQGLEAGRLAAAIETAKRRWHDFPYARGFVVDKLTFVQNTIDNCWTDLNGCPLKPQIHADAL